MTKEKIKYAGKGDKITMENCPHCNEQLVIDLGKGESEVFTCKNCDFKIKKKK